MEGQNTCTQRRHHVVSGQTFGSSHCTLYEVCFPTQCEEAPLLFVWLHGADRAGELPASNLCMMQRRLRRRTFFLVPLSPKKHDGKGFEWGLSYTKEQNKNGFGFVNGEFNWKYLTAITDVVRESKEEVGACGVLVCGYSMGGFGAYQFGIAAPDLFDVVVAVAGYGLGTLEKGQGASQPKSSEIFQRFLDEHARRLIGTRVVAVHARKDSMSYFGDTEAIIEWLNAQGGQAELSTIPDKFADSDPGKSKNGHRYFNHSLLHDTSDQVLYARLPLSSLTPREPSPPPPASPSPPSPGSPSPTPAPPPPYNRGDDRWEPQDNRWETWEATWRWEGNRWEAWEDNRWETWEATWRW